MSTRPPDRVRIALLHLAPVLGDLAGNTARAEAAARAAAAEGARWVVTPELCLTGYDFTPTLGTEWIVAADADPSVARLADLAAELGIVLFLSHPERDPATRRLHIAVFALGAESEGPRVGRTLAVHRKVQTAFGAEAWASKAEAAAPVVVDGVRVGLMLCADAYTERVAGALAAAGAEILLSPAAWPPEPHGPGECWARRSAETGLPLLVCNRTGQERDGLDFGDGESAVFVGGERRFGHVGPETGIVYVEWERSSGAVRHLRAATRPVHGGDVGRAAAEVGRDPAGVLDFSANIHPWGAPPGVLAAARAAIDTAHRYPSPNGEPLRWRLSERVGAEVVLGNGATELLRAAVADCRRVWVRAPSYLGYAEAAWPAEVRHGDGAEPGDAIVVGRPNNPDGHLPTVEEVAALRRPGVRVVVDESFLGFSDAPSCVGLDGVMVVTSLTKTFGIPGLRLGWATRVDPRLVPTWTVNAAALAAGLACLEAWDWPRRVPLDDWRTALARELAAFGEVRGAANFLLLALPEPRGPELRARMLREHGVLVRDASNFTGLDERHLRVAVRTPEENARLVEALACACSS